MIKISYIFLAIATAMTISKEVKIAGTYGWVTLMMMAVIDTIARG
jgi:hypothetical protein